MKFIQISAALGMAAMVAACSQPEPERMVTPEPVFNKYGDGACEEGYDFVAGTAAQPPVCIPDDGCTPVYDSAGNVIDCPPPPGRGDDDRDDSSTSSGRPTGTAGTP